MSRKPRSDAKLKTLPDDVQEQLWDYAQSHSLLDACRWLLQTHGVRTSAAALSEWWSWYATRRQLQRNSSVVEALLDRLRGEEPQLSEDQLRRLGQQFFALLSIEQRDPRAWAAIQRLELSRRELELERRRLAVLEQRARQAEEAAKAAGDDRLDPDERLRRIKEALGIAT